GRRAERGGSAGARPETPDGEVAGVVYAVDPVDCRDEPLGQERDVEPKMCRSRVDVFFVPGQKVAQERAQALLAKRLGHVSVAGTEAAAPAAVGEHDYASSGLREGQVAGQPDPCDLD